MKKKLLFFLLLFLGIFKINAQKSALTFIPITKDTLSYVDLITAYQSLTISGYIKNNTKQTLKIRWERNLIQIPSSWSIQIHDTNNNYADFVDSNIDKSLYLNEPIILAPNATTKLDVQFSPNGTVGKAILGVELYLTENPEVIISGEEIKVEIRTKASNSSRSASVYPNPSSNFLNVSNMQNVERMVVYNMVGRAVKDFEIAEGANYEIGNLPNGIYLVGLFDKSGNIIKTVRISKRGTRP